MEDEGSQQKNEEVRVAVDHLSALSCKKYIEQTFAGLRVKMGDIYSKTIYAPGMHGEEMQLYLHLFHIR